LSDSFLKKNIRKIPDALSRISKLDGKEYQWKDGDDTTSCGFIAQEVQKIFPDVSSLILVFEGPF